MQVAEWEETHRSLVARIAGLLGLATVVIALMPGGLGGPLFENISTPQILDWVKHNGASITLAGLVGGVQASAMALMIFALVFITRGRGLLATIAAASAAAFMAIDWVHSAVYFGLADAGQRSGADSGVVALFSLTKQMTFADGFVFGLAVVAVSVVALQSRTLPAPLAWLGLVVGGFHLVSLPIQIVISGTAGGATGPISVVMALLWILSTSAILLIRPVWGPRQATLNSAPAH
jgi:hypothetical protein